MEQKVTWQRGGKRGTKRYKYLGDDSKYNMFSEDEGEGLKDIQEEEQESPNKEKRRRSRSPDHRKTPDPPKQENKSPEERLGTTPPLRTFSDVLMRRKKPEPQRTEEDEEAKPRTPVRVKIKRLERGKEVQTPGRAKGGVSKKGTGGKGGKKKESLSPSQRRIEN